MSCESGSYAGRYNLLRFHVRSMWLLRVRLHPQYPQGARRIRNARSSRTAALPRRFAPRNDTGGAFEPALRAKERGVATDSLNYL